MNDLDALDHVAVNVSDLDAALEWYRSSFDCQIIRRSETRASIRFSNIELELVLPSQQPPHLAFKRSDADQLGHLRQQPDGRFSTMISDPSGNIVEIVQAGADRHDRHTNLHGK